MTDQPGREPEQRLPARRPPSEAVPAERFTAAPAIHRNDLTPERAAKIVRQSANARWIAFLAVSIVALFVIVYYFYEVGAPLGMSTPRLQAQADAQQVTAVERGYNLFQANCARCHGANGEGGIGPVLNDQAKLFDHLNPQYLKNVLTAGGRYVCGNPNSVMPIWADTNGGPLNYRQIEELIDFIRAPKTQTFTVRDPNTNEPIVGSDGKDKTFTGWVDANFKPAPGSSPVPACWSGTPGGGGASPSPAGSLPPDATTLKITAENIAFDVKELSVAADKPFAIDFTQKDAGVGGHNVDIRTQDGQVVFSGQVLTDPGQTTYSIPGLKAGTYTFICKIHPIPAMSGTLTVK